MDNKLNNDFLGSIVNKWKTLHKIKDNLGEKKDNTDDAAKKSLLETNFLIVCEKFNDHEFLIIGQKLPFTKENMDNYKTLEKIHSGRIENESGEYNCAALISDLSFSSTEYKYNNEEKYKSVTDYIGSHQLKHDRIPGESLLITKIDNYNSIPDVPAHMFVDWYSIFTNKKSINDVSFDVGQYEDGIYKGINKFLINKYEEYKTFFCYPISKNDNDKNLYLKELKSGITDLLFRMWDTSISIRTNILTNNIETLDYKKLNEINLSGTNFNLSSYNDNGNLRPWLDIESKIYKLKFYKNNDKIIIYIDDIVYSCYDIDEELELCRVKQNNHKIIYKNLPEDIDVDNNKLICEQFIILRSNANNDEFNKIMLNLGYPDNSKRCINMRGGRVIGEPFNWCSKDKRNILNFGNGEAMHSFIITMWMGCNDRDLGIHVNYNKSASDPNTCKEYLKQIFVHNIDKITSEHIKNYSIKPMNELPNKLSDKLIKQYSLDKINNSISNKMLEETDETDDMIFNTLINKNNESVNESNNESDNESDNESVNESDNESDNESVSDGGDSDGGDSDGGKSDGGKSDGGKSDGGKSDGGKSDGGKSDGGDSDGGESDDGISNNFPSNTGSKRKDFTSRTINKKLNENPYDPIIGVNLKEFGIDGIFLRQIDHKNKDRSDVTENNCQPLSIISHALKTSDERSNGNHDIFNKLLNNEEKRSKVSIHIITELIKGINNSCPNYKEEVYNAVNDAIS